MKLITFKNFFIRSGIFERNIDACVMNRNLQDQIVPEDGNTELLNVDGSFAVYGENCDINKIKTPFSLHWWQWRHNTTIAKV